jgi:hypothetical protein
MAQKLAIGIAAILVTVSLTQRSPAQAANPASAPTTTPTPAAASSTPPTPTYDPNAGAIINGLKGIVTGTTSSMSTYRSSKRFLAFRAALTAAIFKGNGKPMNAVTDEAVLCDARKTYADVAAESAYLNSITSGLDKFASPAKITTLGGAFLSLFNRYSIDIPPANVNVDTSTVTYNNCVNDLKSWENSYYNYVIPLSEDGVEINPKASANPIDAIVTLISPISSLFSTLVGIVTPIAVDIGSAEAAARINDAIDKYLHESRTNLVNAAQELATVSAALADSNRYQAVGQFIEKMAAVRETAIDMSKFTIGAAKKPCTDVTKTATAESDQIVLTTSANTPAGNATLHFASVPQWLAAGMKVYGHQQDPNVIPAKATVKSKNATTKTVVISADVGGEGVPEKAQVGFTYLTVSDEFVQCYAQAWQQMLTTVTDAVTAAGAYDAIADASSDQLNSAVATIEKHMADVDNPQQTGASDLLAAATQLLAFGQAVETALSPDNLSKVQTEVSAVAKQFGATAK